MKEKLYETCENILNDEQESKKFMEMKTIDKIYEYLSSKIPDLSEKEFEEFMLDAFEECRESCENAKKSVGPIDEDDLENIAGGVNLGTKIVSAGLALMSFFPAISAANPRTSDLNPSGGISISQRADNDANWNIPSKWEKAKSWAKEHKKSLIAAGIITAALAVTAGVAYKIHKSKKQAEKNNAEALNIQNPDVSKNNPLSKGQYRVFKIAVIGSDIVNGNPIGQDFNKETMETLCRAGSRLENFDGIEIANDHEIAIGNQRLPRTSILYGRDVFSFYDVSGTYDPEIIKDCAYAICPYRINTNEDINTDWTMRMTRLRDFIKSRNAMCDIRFLGVINGDKTEEISQYITRSQRVATQGLDNSPYQQTINTSWLIKSSLQESINFNFNLWLEWDREGLFREVMHKSFPKVIKNDGMNPALSQLN